MTTHPSPEDSGVQGSGPHRMATTPLDALSDIAAVTRRYVIHFWRVPDLLILSVIQSIMFVLLFRYVFGGAIDVPGGRYVDYLMPGIFVQTTLFGGAVTAIGLSYDMKGGIIDRFRTLPMARSAVLAGRTTADLLRNVIELIVMLLVGALVGFRIHGSPVDAVLALLLVLAVGYAFSWLYATIGLLVKNPETAQTASFLPLFPLIFASSAFVPIHTMPSWLRGFAEHQPVSLAVDACRALFHGQPAWDHVWPLLIWLTAVCVIFIPLSVRVYRRI